MSTREPLQVGPITLGFVERPGFHGFCATWNGVELEVSLEGTDWSWSLEYNEGRTCFAQDSFGTAEDAAEDLRCFLVALKGLAA